MESQSLNIPFGCVFSWNYSLSCARNNTRYSEKKAANTAISYQLDLHLGTEGKLSDKERQSGL